MKSKDSKETALHKAAKACDCMAKDQCMIRPSGICNIIKEKRCSHFARVILVEQPKLRKEYEKLPKRGPYDTVELQQSTQKWGKKGEKG